MSVMLTVPEALVWICTRNVEAILEIQKYPVSEQLVVAMHQFRGGMALPRWRVRLDEVETAPIGQWVGRSENYSQIALSEFTSALLKGHLAVYVGHNAVYKSLEMPEIVELSLRTGDWPNASCAFWDKTLSQLVHVEPRFCQADLERIWPAPRIPATTKIANIILEALLATMGDRPIKKEAARELAQTIPGYRRRIFERLWKEQFPADRKFRRGQRGPNRIAA